MSMPSPHRKSVVVCDNVSVSYGAEDVVRNVSLSIQAGSFMPFLGPNGAGKTTLLRAVLGLLKTRSGTIETDFGGRPAGYVPQQRVIDPLLPISTRKLVSMGLYPETGLLRRITAKQQKRVDNALDRLGLLNHGNKTFAELSGGMKQKALVARALVSDAEVFVMDEPTSELDPDSKQVVLACLYDMTLEGKTVLLAHHGLNGLAEFTSVACFMTYGHASVAPLQNMTATSPARPAAGTHEEVK